MGRQALRKASQAVSACVARSLATEGARERSKDGKTGGVECLRARLSPMAADGSAGHRYIRSASTTSENAGEGWRRLG